MSAPAKSWMVCAICVFPITIFWFLLSVYFSFMLIGVADTTDVRIVPLWLKISWDIALFPSNFIEYLIGLGGFDFSRLPDRVAASISFLVMFVNSGLWGFFLYLLFRRMARCFTVDGLRKSES